MSLAKCAICLESPCVCGDAYKYLSDKDLGNLIYKLQVILAKRKGRVESAPIHPFITEPPAILRVSKHPDPRKDPIPMPMLFMSSELSFFEGMSNYYLERGYQVVGTPDGPATVWPLPEGGIPEGAVELVVVPRTTGGFLCHPNDDIDCHGRKVINNGGHWFGWYVSPNEPFFKEPSPDDE